MADQIVSSIEAVYKEWLAEVKTDYRRSQIKAAIKVNEELLLFYWRLGREINRLRLGAQWGAVSSKSFPAT